MKISTINQYNEDNSVTTTINFEQKLHHRLDDILDKYDVYKGVNYQPFETFVRIEDGVLYGSITISN